MSKKTQMAAMKYLADKQPKKYRLETDLDKGHFRVQLLVWDVFCVEGWKSWLDFHTVEFPEPKKIIVPCGTELISCAGKPYEEEE